MIDIVQTIFYSNNCCLTGVKIAVESITDITNIDSTIDLYMTQVWNSNQTRNESLKLSGEDIANFGWTPDIYFILAKTVIYNNIAQYLHFEESGMVSRAFPLIFDLLFKNPQKK